MSKVFFSIDRFWPNPFVIVGPNHVQKLYKSDQSKQPVCIMHCDLFISFNSERKVQVLYFTS